MNYVPTPFFMTLVKARRQYQPSRRDGERLRQSMVHVEMPQPSAHWGTFAAQHK